MIKGFFTSLLSILFISTLLAQDHRHDFDFWIGEWDVYTYGTTNLVGFNTIKPIYSHNFIEETYHTPNGFAGKSVNFYDKATNQWEQQWIDATGYVLKLHGGLEDGNMVLRDCINETEACNKIIWTPMPDGSVRQQWFVKDKGNAQWKSIFDGHYKQKTVTHAEHVLAMYDQLQNVRDFTVATSETEAYTTVQSATEDTRVIVRLTKQNNAWSMTQIAAFSGRYHDIEPYLSPDNLSLYFASNRPLPGEEEVGDYNIWVVRRNHVASPWEEPSPMSEVNTVFDEFYPAISNTGNLYFTSVREDDRGKDNIYMSEWNGTTYLPAVALPKEINTDGYEFNSYIAPDESYILFSGYNREDGLGSGDIYISKRMPDGGWTQAENLGVASNTAQMEYCPYVVNGKLYFTSRRNTEQHTEPKSLQALFDQINRYENGFSRIYAVEWQPE